jgi:hypothetical protein
LCLHILRPNIAVQGVLCSPFKVFHYHSSVIVHSFTQHQKVVTFWNYSLFGICPSFLV